MEARETKGRLRFKFKLNFSTLADALLCSKPPVSNAAHSVSPLPSPTPPLPDGEAPVGCPGRSPSPSLTLGLQVAVSPSRGHRLSRHYRSPPLAVASARSPIHVAVAVSHSRTPADLSCPCPKLALGIGAVCHLLASTLACWSVYGWTPGLFHFLLDSLNATSVVALGPKESEWRAFASFESFLIHNGSVSNSPNGAVGREIGVRGFVAVAVGRSDVKIFDGHWLLAEGPVGKGCSKSGVFSMVLAWDGHCLV
nr:uncharacterized protein LOC109189493 [Ipomoea batatas]